VVVIVVEHVEGVVQEEVAPQEVVGVLVMVCGEGKLLLILILFLIIRLKLIFFRNSDTIQWMMEK
jgi:hypothetical protein